MEFHGSEIWDTQSETAQRCMYNKKIYVKRFPVNFFVKGLNNEVYPESYRIKFEIEYAFFVAHH